MKLVDHVWNLAQQAAFILVLNLHCLKRGYKGPNSALGPTKVFPARAL